MKKKSKKKIIKLFKFVSGETIVTEVVTSNAEAYMVRGSLQAVLVSVYPIKRVVVDWIPVTPETNYEIFKSTIITAINIEEEDELYKMYEILMKEDKLSSNSSIEKVKENEDLFRKILDNYDPDSDEKDKKN